MLDLRVNHFSWIGTRELRSPSGGPALSVRPALVHMIDFPGIVYPVISHRILVIVAPFGSPQSKLSGSLNLVEI